MNEKIIPYSEQQAIAEAERIQKKAQQLRHQEKATSADYENANDIIDEENRLFQGEKTKDAFLGNSTSEAMKETYNESAEFFENIIRKLLPDKNKTYAFADFGCHQGELMQKVIELLPDYKLKTVGIDLEKNLEENHVAQEKIPAKLSEIPVDAASFDFGMMRYVLQWNNPENQRRILKEIARTVKDFAIIQQVCSDNENPGLWREKFDSILDGKEIPKLKRNGHFFPSKNEIEQLMREEGIEFETIQNRRINNTSDIYIERFGLDEKEAAKAKLLLGDMDYNMQTTWIIFPSEKPETTRKRALTIAKEISDLKEYGDDVRSSKLIDELAIILENNPIIKKKHPELWEIVRKHDIKVLLSVDPEKLAELGL